MATTNSTFAFYCIVQERILKENIQQNDILTKTLTENCDMYVLYIYFCLEIFYQHFIA